MPVSSAGGKARSGARFQYWWKGEVRGEEEHDAQLGHPAHHHGHLRGSCGRRAPHPRACQACATISSSKLPGTRRGLGFRRLPGPEQRRGRSRSVTVSPSALDSFSSMSVVGVVRVLCTWVRIQRIQQSSGQCISDSAVRPGWVYFFFRCDSCVVWKLCWAIVSAISCRHGQAQWMLGLALLGF